MGIVHTNNLIKTLSLEHHKINSLTHYLLQVKSLTIQVSILKNSIYDTRTINELFKLRNDLTTQSQKT